MNRTRQIVSTIAAAAVLCIGIGGCASPTSPPETAATSAAPTPSTPPQPEAESVIISAREVSILTADETMIASFDFFEPEVDEAVEALTDAFGSEPTIVHSEPVSSQPEANNYEWPGFALMEYLGVTPAFPDVNAFRVVVTAPTVGTIAVIGLGRVQAGMAESDVAPLATQHRTDTGAGRPIEFYSFDVRPVELSYDPGYPPTIAVSAWVEGGVVLNIAAPGMNYGA